MFSSLTLGIKMTTGADVRDILELGGTESENVGTINKKDIINSDKVHYG